jgi:N-methylhydantoinase A
VVNISRTCSGSVEQLDFAMVAEILEDMEARANAMLVSAGAAEGDITVHRSVDVRYKGQGYEIEVPISEIAFGPSDAAAIRAELARRFAEQYARSYGRVLGNADLEATTWRIRAEGRNQSESGSLKVAIATGDDAPVDRRAIFFGTRVGFVETPLYDRYRLPPDSSGTGPALMQERETTVVVPPRAYWRVDEQMNLRVRLEANDGSREAADGTA